MSQPFDMIGVLRLTKQGRLKEAVAAIRARLPGAPKPAGGYPPPLWEGHATPAPEAGLAKVFKDILKPAPPISVRPPGSRFESFAFTNAAGARNYKLFIPSGYSGQPLPLIVMLHGCTQSPDDFAAGTQMNTLAEQRNFLVAYPAQAHSANLTKCWNWYQPNDQKRDAGEPSIIAGITRQIIETYSVLPGRVYVAGLSAGGAAAAIMGAAYPELFAAAGVHSGLACGAAHDMLSAMMAMRQGAPAAAAPERCHVTPAIVFHGDHDHTVNVINADQVITQSQGTASLTKTVTQGTSEDGMAYTRTVQTDQTGRPVLEEWILHGAGHAWSGGSKAGSFTDPRGPDASREMLRFFLAQS